MEITNGELIRNETNQNAMGGTELMATRMHELIPQDLLEGVQIIHSRPRELRNDLKKVLVLHDLPGDPEVQHLKDGGWKKYDKLVFVSNWQLQMYNAYLGVPYSHSVVLKNAINPISEIGKNDNVIKIIYHTTPHRGLNVLYAVFDAIARTDDKVQLDVYSSFKIYGWEQRDEPYKELFDKLREHPQVNYYGSVPNDEVRRALGVSHIFAYPSIWQETSCISLMEAMSAGCLCVHPNYAALPETSAGMTQMYQWTEDMNKHADVFYNNLVYAIQTIRQRTFNGRAQKTYADAYYNWANRRNEWCGFLEAIKNS